METRAPSAETACPAPAPGARRDRSREVLLAVPAAGIGAGVALLLIGPPWALAAAAAVLGWTQLSGP